MIPKTVVVHSGARDEYHVAHAMLESGLLERLVTNFYFPEMSRRRYGQVLPRSRVKVPLPAFAAFAAARAFKCLDVGAFTERCLGRNARSIAAAEGASAFCCSYSAYTAFTPGPSRPARRFLFQIHPHPVSVRRLLCEELNRVPAARKSLEHEIEMQLRESDFARLAAEAGLANGWVAASNFTALTLAENGIPSSSVRVVPYGVNLERYVCRLRAPDPAAPFTIMFLGTLLQRKGLSYLLDAVRQLKTRHIRVLLRGRGFVDSALLAEYRDVSFDLQMGLPTDDIIRDLHSADLFVLPSLLEGFGHVLLQAMACGVPVLATTNTAAPDLLTDRVEGFIVPIRDAAVIADRIEWGIRNRGLLAEMGRQASLRANHFTWDRFRATIGAAYSEMVAALEPAVVASRSTS